MQKVAAHAEELGETELADSVRTEIAHYENSPSYGELMQDVRQQLEYIGMDLNADFRLVEKNLARELGVSVAEFRKRLPEAKKLFQSGRANALARKERLSRLKQ